MMHGMGSKLHEALMDLMGVLNSPQADEVLLGRAGVSLERALFPLLVRIGLRGPIGVVELAEQVGRDHSTVSRQLAKLETLGLIRRKANAEDQRTRAAVITADGERTVARIAKARNRLFDQMMRGWSVEDRANITRLTRRLADAIKQASRNSA
jgi:DNA-binding MarR family transcriptional regulator